MKKVGFALCVLSGMGCYDYDGAYAAYCSRVNCDGGSSGGGSVAGGSVAGGSVAGGSTAGGSTAGGSVAGGSTAGGAGGGGDAGGSSAGGSVAGGSTAGGSVAGGSAGGSIAGGSVAGGSTAGGSVAGGSAGGTVDAGVMCVGVPFCVHRHTVRTDFKEGDGVVGDTLDNPIGLISRFSGSPWATLWVTHGPDATPSPGTARPLTGLTPPLRTERSSAADFVFITESNLTTARLRQVIDGGVPVIRYSGTCAGQSILANSFARRGDRVIIGGYDDSLCDLQLSTGMTAVIQPESPDGGGRSTVDDIYLGADGGIIWATSDGYLGRVGQGRITAEIDVDGVIGMDGLDHDTVWAVTYNGTVVASVPDGGFELVHSLAERCYSMTVTPDGVFVGMFGGIGHRTAFTTNPFERYTLPGDSNQRISSMSGGRGALHVVGNEGPFNNLTNSFFFTLIPRTQ